MKDSEPSPWGSVTNTAHKTRKYTSTTNGANIVPLSRGHNSVKSDHTDAKHIYLDSVLLTIPGNVIISDVHRK